MLSFIHSFIHSNQGLFLLKLELHSLRVHRLHPVKIKEFPLFYLLVLEYPMLLSFTEWLVSIKDISVTLNWKAFLNQCWGKKNLHYFKYFYLKCESQGKMGAFIHVLLSHSVTLLLWNSMFLKHFSKSFSYLYFSGIW